MVKEGNERWRGRYSTHLHQKVLRFLLARALGDKTAVERNDSRQMTTIDASVKGFG